MKKQLYLLFILLLTLLCFQSNASHIVGADISYQCTSTIGVYKITMKVYRDCASSSLCTSCSNSIPNGTVAGCTTSSSNWSTQIVGVSSLFLGVSYGAFNLNAVSLSSGFDIIQTCTSVNTICTNCNTRNAGTFSPGMEVYTFEGNVDLSGIPTACCRVVLGANQCCRSSSTTTMVAGSFQMVCEIDRCQSVCNSAPTFTNDATVLVCAGADFVYNLGAMDPDGDSLSYTFGQSLQGIGSSVQYFSPYSASYPFPYFGAPNVNSAYPAGLRIDATTGDILFRPMGIFVSNLVIEVTQWKLVGSIRVNVGMTRRDVQFQTQLCLSNKIPLIKTYKNGILQTVSSYTATAGQPFCLDIVAQDQQDLNTTPQIVADTTDLKWNNPGLYIPVMANATFISNYILANRGINGPKADSFKFCWTPPIDAVRQEPYLFTVNGRDRFCPITAFATRGIIIKVEAPKTIFIDSTTKNSYCNNKVTTTNVNYRTSGLNLLSGNVFTVQLSDSSGSFTNATNIGAKTTTDNIGFIPVSIPTGLFLNRNYKIKVNASSDSVNTIYTYAINLVAGFSTPIITNNRDSFCQGLVTTFKVTPNTTGLTFKWLKNNVVLANETKDSLLVDSAFTYRAIVSNAVCVDTSNAKTIVVHAKPTANFTAPNSFCFSVNSNVISLINTSILNTGSLNYNWLFSDGTNSNLFSPTKTINTANNLTVKLIAVSNNNCSDSILKTILINQKPNSNFISNTYSQCRNNNIFTFVHDSIAGNNYSWDFGDSTFASNATPIKNYSKAGSYLVKLTEQNPSGCFDTTIKTVNVYPNPLASFEYMAAREQCLKNNQFVFNNNSTIESGTMSYKWVMGENDTIIQQNSTKTFSKKGRYDIYLYCNSNHNCTDLRMNDVTVYDPKIDSIIGNKNPSISLIPYTYSVSYQTSVLFDWTITNGVILSGQGTNSVNVIWSSTGTGMLKARINEAYTCYDSTNLLVNITSVGVQNLSLANDLKVYPNPTKNSITISNKNNLAGKKYIITNLVGQTIISGKLNLDETIVNLENLQSGVYLLSIDGLNKQSIKVMKE